MALKKYEKYVIGVGIVFVGNLLFQKFGYLVNRLIPTKPGA